MKKYYLEKISKTDRKNLCARSAVGFPDLLRTIRPVVERVKKEGDLAVQEYTELFDMVRIENTRVIPEEIEASPRRVPKVVQDAMTVAYKNIERFHRAQKSVSLTLETMPGVTCMRQTRPIEKIGLYIPGGSAPLPSTVLMLGIPAQIAGCRDIVLCTPPQKDGSIPPSILYVARLCGITQIFKVGGAQAIAAMAYGTATIPKVYKIFGPGNQYVTAAKMLVSIDPAGAAIDMPAGPSEILVVADRDSRTDFVAADLLSQAEHSPDAHIVLVSTNEATVDAIQKEVETQMQTLPREAIAAQSLQKSFAVVTKTIEEALTFVNEFAPEHLVLQIAEAEKYIDEIVNAGSVFLGPYSPESAGDYASGTNHTLPTYGYARTYSGVSVEHFEKSITFQKITPEGVKNIGPTVMELARLEGLTAHERAMGIRLQSV